MGKYEHLFSPGRIGGLEIQNRAVMPAMATGLATYDGYVTSEMLTYYQARAISGPGIIVVEMACVDAPRGKGGLVQLRLDHPRYQIGLNRLAEGIKIGGSRVFLQLHHAGRQGSPLMTEGQKPLAPSAIACPTVGVEPEAASPEDIKRIISKFVSSAKMAHKCRFDGVELHSAHGYLLSQFISPHTNRRTDDYGGNTENRARIVTEIIQGIKKAAPDLVVGVRLNINDFIEGGVTPGEGVALAEIMEKAGADYISASSGMYESGLTSIEPVSFPEAWRADLARAVKARVKIPVFGGGVVRHPDVADRLIKEEAMDFVFVGRAQLADERWVALAREGKKDEIRPCMSCNTCIGRAFQNRHMACAVNPSTARELWLGPVIPTADPRRVLVVGGGPGGMAAAAILAEKGHRVTLVEKNRELGGMLDAASRPPFKYRLTELKDYLIGKLLRTSARVIMGRALDLDLLEEIKPDYTVVATGSVPRTLPGLTEAPTCRQAVDVLLGPLPPEGQEVVVIGGGITGCETAFYLAKNGCRVTLVEMTEKLAAGLENMNRTDLLMAMRKAGVRIMTGSAVESVDGQRIVINGKEGKQELSGMVVLALGFDSCVPLDAGMRKLAGEICIIGDAGRPGNIENALFEARVMANRI